jgi:TonB family protein
MKHLSLCFLFLTISVFVKSQNDDKKVFSFVEQMPEFPGGSSALMKFIQEHVVYPKSEIDLGIQGKVIVRFVVMEDGTVDSVNVIQRVSPLLDKEAVRVTKQLPKFIPGHQQGKPVRVYYNLPFQFKFQVNSTPSDLKENKDPDFRNALSLIRYEDYKEALKALQYSLEKFPEDYLTYEKRAECEVKLGKLADACTDFNKAKNLGSPSALNSIKQYCN